MPRRREPPRWAPCRLAAPVVLAALALGWCLAGGFWLFGSGPAAPPAAPPPPDAGPPAETTTLSFRDGPRVSSAAWVGLCHSMPMSLDAAKAACRADAECSMLHDAGCDGERVRRCFRGLELVELVEDGRDRDGCTIVVDDVAGEEEEEDVVVVPAVYKRWGDPSPPRPFSRRPFWAYPSQGRKVFMYQRLYEDQPLFVPNFGYEGTVYLKFIVDHYRKLPALMIFVQDDYRWKGFEDCICRNITYYDLDGTEHDRASSDWMQYPWGAAVDQCWRDLADIFRLGGVEDGVAYGVRMHPCNNFAVGRGTILRRPLSQWRAAYELASRPVCHPGGLNESRLSAEVLRSQESLFQRGSIGAKLLHDQPGWTKHTSGGALEHLRDAIYNVTPAAASSCAREVFAGRQCRRR